MRHVLGATMMEGKIGPFPPIYLGEFHCVECKHKHEFELCPFCGGWIDFQYGIGGLKFWCRDHHCRWFYYIPDSE